MRRSFVKPKSLLLHKRTLAAIAGLVLVGVAVTVWLASRQTAAAQDAGRPSPELMQRPKNYSPYVEQSHPIRVYWGDQHLHTAFSSDAGMLGDRLGPDDAFRFARGEQLRSSTGQLAQLERPYDWLVVSDHAEYLGLAQELHEKNPVLLDTASGRKWGMAFKEGGQAAVEAFHELVKEMTTGKASLPPGTMAKLMRTPWDRGIEAAERNNKPGVFTAFIGFEWTQHVQGNNQHRVVVFRDNAERAKQVLPFSAFDSVDPEDLWKYMAAYEEKTGGRVSTKNMWKPGLGSSVSWRPVRQKATARRHPGCPPPTNSPTLSAGTRPICPA
jgi:hypothetical protein